MAEPSVSYYEDKPTQVTEEFGKKIPNISFLGLAFGSIAASAAITFFGKNPKLGNFVGLWAPTLLVIGVYNKIAKLERKLGVENQQINVH